VFFLAVISTLNLREMRFWRRSPNF